MKAEMFDVWLKNSPDASWTDLAAAVKDQDTVSSDIADSPPGNKINVEHNTFNNKDNNYIYFLLLTYMCLYFIDISPHTVLDPVSNLKGVSKPVSSVNTPDNVLPTTCWQQIRNSLVQFIILLCTNCRAWASIIVIIAAISLFFYQY